MPPFRRELTDFLANSFWTSSAPVYFHSGAANPDLVEALSQHPEADNCLIFATSGSSGSSKWVALTRPALLWSAQQVITRFGLDSRDVLGLALPDYHVGGFSLYARAYLSGARLAVFSQKWTPDDFSCWLREQGVTVCSLVPTQVHDLVMKKIPSPPSLRILLVGGGRLDPALQQQARHLGWPVLSSYGMTETGAQLACENEQGELELNPGWQARSDEDGRLWLRGAGLLHGYLIEGNDGLTFSDPKIDGWFPSDDLAKVSGSILTLDGRTDRQIKIMGELVPLASIEDQFRYSLGADVYLLAQPDERRGFLLHLFAEGISNEDLDQSVANYHASAPGFARLSSWQSLPQLPRSPLGKPLPPSI